VKRLRLLAAARAELLHETRYYEATRPGTGRRFAMVVAQAMDRIRRVSATGKPDEVGCRRMRIQGFPFSIVYREETLEIVIFAIRPDARRPGYWITE
jgi:toxin ParE1/3/4